MSTDSLSLPRPWFQKHPSDQPERFTRFRQTYPYLLEGLLKERFQASEIRVSNLAMRASSLASSYSHRNELFSWMEADVAVLHKGVVDCWPRAQLDGQPHTTLKAFREAMTRLLEERERMAPTLPFIVIGISPTNTATLAKEPKVAENIRAYNAVLSERVDANMRYIDMEHALTEAGEELLHPDGHHLTAGGQALLANRLRDAIIDLLGPDWADRDAAAP
ncbi:SGNH/GDSL hydrolase family protein [Sediminicoccus rosea]|uniref:SGNH/GDSL hydrolase family protein n=1 Tax=Sediminicoccus rosea TaxID=1225128 RepID=A0ABZ0PPQ5_9PROT|nr:SGNH/GDSL hydrolase family protein [Sediminicoccus rosea]WPB87442.1 SGNH/GDSL hydrolase family protein [Sediminicoccus rosea]